MHIQDNKHRLLDMPSNKKKSKKSEKMDLDEKATRKALHDINVVYEGNDDKDVEGLVNVGKSLDDIWKRLELDVNAKLNINAPRQKITVMIVGNHSSGKSSFINWYIGKEDLCKTSMAQQTHEYTFVTYEENREKEARGEFTVRYFPYLKPMPVKFGEAIQKHLKMFIVNKDKNAFKFVDLIDSPGLVGAAVDSEGSDKVHYNFDIDGSIEYLAKHCDLVFVFLDPHGGATQMRTMNVLKRLKKLEKAGDETFTVETFLTKIDQAKTAQDLKKLTASVSVDMAKHIEQQFSHYLPGIFIPTEKRLEGLDEELINQNEINQCTDLIVKAIKDKVSKNFNDLKQDSNKIIARSKAILKENEANTSKRDFRQNISNVLYLSAFAISVYIFVCVSLVMESYLPSSVVETAPYKVLNELSTSFVSGYRDQSYVEVFKSMMSLFGTFFVLVFLARMLKTRAAMHPTLTKDEVKYVSSLELEMEKTLQRRDKLYDKYVLME